MKATWSGKMMVFGFGLVFLFGMTGCYEELLDALEGAAASEGDDEESEAAEEEGESEGEEEDDCDGEDCEKAEEDEEPPGDEEEGEQTEDGECEETEDGVKQLGEIRILSAGSRHGGTQGAVAERP